MKRSLLLLFIATGLIAGCDKREDYFASISEAPALGIQKGDKLLNTLSDSVKVTKAEQKFYPIELRLKTESSEINTLTFQITKGKGHLEYREAVVTTNKLPSEYSAITVKYIPESLGKHEIHFVAKNRFGVKSDLTTSILFFDNLPPKAVLEISKSELGAANEYEFDAGKSYAGDSKFGGYLVNYSFKINNEEYQMKSSKMNFIFPSIGNYQIVLKVTDNDGISNEVTQTFKIEK